MDKIAIFIIDLSLFTHQWIYLLTCDQLNILPILYIIKSMLNLYAYTYMLKKVLHYMYLLHFTLKKMEIIILDLAQFSFIPWL